MTRTLLSAYQAVRTVGAVLPADALARHLPARLSLAVKVNGLAARFRPPDNLRH